MRRIRSTSGAWLTLLSSADNADALREFVQLIFARALSTASGTRSAAKRGVARAALRFGVGDRVRLTEERVFDDRVYPKGSVGAVREVLPVFQAYLVDFDIDSTDRVIPDGVLEPE